MASDTVRRLGADLAGATWGRSLVREKLLSVTPVALLRSVAFRIGFVASEFFCVMLSPTGFATPLIGRGAESSIGHPWAMIKPKVASSVPSISMWIRPIGTDINGCLASPFTFTPVVANQIAAEWQEDTLHGGYMIMQRARL